MFLVRLNSVLALLAAQSLKRAARTDYEAGKLLYHTLVAGLLLVSLVSHVRPVKDNGTL